MKKLVAILFISTLALLFGCKRKFTVPPKKDAPPVSGYITIDSINKRYYTYYSNPAATQVYMFHEDLNVTGVITADEVSGNLYKTVYMRDQTGGLKINLTYSGGLFEGDSIRINLNGVILNDYGKQIQLDSVVLEKNVYKIASGYKVHPIKTTFAQLLNHQSQLVQLDSVEFSSGAKNTMYADAINKLTLDRMLQDGAGNMVDVRTSGYANFAATTIPCGKGTVVAMVGQYNGTPQLTIRKMRDITLSAGTCPILAKNFDDGITTGGWTVQYVTGKILWATSKAGGAATPYASISNYVSGANVPCETWMISPAIDLTSSNNPVLTFRNAYNYAGPGLALLISTDYELGKPSTGTWTSLPFNASQGGFSFANSGNVSLSTYKNQNVHIAFKYMGSNSDGSTWEIDDVAILEN